MPIAALRGALAEAVARVAPGAVPPLAFERPRDPAHGDYASNVAMLLAKPLGMRPMAVAEALADALSASEAIAQVTAAPPGFLNFRVSDAALAEAIAALLAEPPAPALPPAGALARFDSMEAMRLAVHRAALAGLLKSGAGCDDDHVGPVRLLRDGRPAGVLSPEALVAEVGEAATRFHLLTRQLARPLDLDLAQAVRETADNPCFYLRHAHARLAGIMRVAAGEGLRVEALAWGPSSVAGLVQPEERALLLLLAASAESFVEAAAAGAPHRAIRHGLEVAEAFHRLYTANRILGAAGHAPDRLILALAARRVLGRLLERVVRVPAPEEL
ncbi:MAG: DALR anticodon-binding domain-containing protein [Candidatus Sericytochromatia bacterium]